MLLADAKAVIEFFGLNTTRNRWTVDQSKRWPACKDQAAGTKSVQAEPRERERVLIAVWLIASTSQMLVLHQ